MSTQNTVKPSGPCEKYELAITNYVLGEKIDIPQAELFDHLARCPSCQGDLRNWRATYATMRAKEYDSRPEVKQKMKTFIHELVASQPAPGETTGQVKLAPGENLLDHKVHVGSAAGVVWRWLGKYGKTNLTDLPEKVKLSPLNTYEAVGWLAHEKKVYRSYVKQITYAWLNEHEQSIYQEEARV